ncbi:MAG: DUF1330 domain-containing protein [Pseudomonadota bacterium]
MTAYSVLEVTPENEDWIEAYLPIATKVIKRHNGKYLARTTTHEVLEGEDRKVGLRIVIAWPSMDAARAFESDPEYKPHLESRLANSRSHHVLIEGKDDLSQA